MSDNPNQPPMPPHVAVMIGQLLDEEAMSRLNQSCELALKRQLNKNNSDPRLKALENEWRTMDRFSKRESGPGDVKK
jgi:macrodomain Ter protein organizer (MatP/YcbG family)